MSISSLAQSIFYAVLVTATTCHADAPWRDVAHVRVLENDALQVTLRAGIPGELVDKQSGQRLIGNVVE